MKVSVIIPCYNEEEVLPLSHKRFSQVMESTAHDYELIFVNDGSKDHTEELLLGFANDDPHTKVISFSRNFGHQNAVSAGLHNCTGDIAVIIDVDLQDPPEVIPQMIDTYLKEGSNVVYAVRNKREGETFMKKFTAKIYYRMLNSLSDYTFPVDTGDFRLIDRKVLDAFKQFPEKHKYLRGLFSWMGFKQTPFYYTTFHFYRIGFCYLGIHHVPFRQRIYRSGVVFDNHYYRIFRWSAIVYHRNTRRVYWKHLR